MSLTITLAIASAILPFAQAHMSLWHPSMYGFSNDWQAVTPLANQPFDQWWFHGNLNDKPEDVMSIIPGQNLNVEIACSKAWTSWGDRNTADACPNDAGSYHAGGTTGSESGWGGNSEENLLGCALAIAYKSHASQVQPEDFIVMSVQENCVRQRDTSFAIPSNLPSCPNGECTCAWFWQGKNSALEMYMTGFRCNVQGGVATSSYPSPAKPVRGNKIYGPTQPMYWANTPTNIGYEPSWSTKPSYNQAFGWQNGAQESAFASAAGGTQPPNSSLPVSVNSSTPTTSSYGEENDWSPSTTSQSVKDQWASPTSSERHRPTHWFNHAADPLPTDEKVDSGKKCKRRLRSRNRRAHRT